MSVYISGIVKKSYADICGIQAGDVLLSLNGYEIDDVLDYRFYMMERHLIVTISRQDICHDYVINKKEYDDIGLEFETYLMDVHQRCRNKCIFCFIDQLPPGMRESLYFKDDDSRLSFLFGNYITLTSLDDKEVDRIIKMHISPINISVHTTNPDLRIKMMRNRYAGESLKIMNRLYDAGIKMNCQIVVCPGYNDGNELIRTVHDLANMYPSVESIACVPLGVTKYRDELEQLVPFNARSAAETLDLILMLGVEMLQKTGARIVYPSDEFFLLAGRDLPNDDWYGDYSQLENGVGMLTLLETQFADALDDAPNELVYPRDIAVATGKAASAMINKLADAASAKWKNFKCTVYTINNDFFGDSITVAGLITATDLEAQLNDKVTGKELLISCSMLRRGENVFLDDISIDELSEKLKCNIIAIENDGKCLLDAFIGYDNEQ